VVDRALAQAAADTPEEIPRYTIPEAAGYLHMPRATLASWVAGRPYDVKAGRTWWDGLITRPPGSSRLSFSNLIEAYTLLALRSEYSVRMDEVRTALKHAAEHYEIPRFLLSEHLRATKGNVFLERMGQVVNVGKAGQQGFPEVLGAYLKRIEFDAGIAARLAPVTRLGPPSNSPTIVLINPRLAFGRPVVRRKTIKTATIGERFDVGESVAAIAADYGLQISEVEEAIRYERLARAA
jgi:uncharacterized protein (DUF433 family)